MEFLVRLGDKTNIQVFCFNPVHRGNHMNRVFYEDNTFEAPCPECGDTGEWLYRKNNAITKKGHYITFKPDGWDWGSNERKHYGIVRIGCTEEQAQKWCEGIVNEQALTDAKGYRSQVESRRQSVIDNIKRATPIPTNEEELTDLKTAIRTALAFDTQYITLSLNERQSENRAMIDTRPRKQAFDFEKVLSVSELKNWNDMGKYSKVIEFNTTTINMKAIV